MPPEMSKELQQALASDCAESVEPVLERKRAEDHEALRKLVAGELRSKPGQRATAIFLLGAWGERSGVEPIVNVLPDLDDAERIGAIDALGRLGTPEALAGVISCARDRSPDVRKFVTHALGRIGTSPARRKLREIQETDSATNVRDLAEKYLAR